MSELSWRILSILMENAGGDFTRVRYMAGWTLGEKMGLGALAFQAADVLHGSSLTQNEYERALRELVDLGIVEEMPDLGERWRLVVKYPKPETPPVVEKPGLKDYWKGKL